MAHVMPKDRDDESGKYTESYPLTDFIAVLQEIGPAGTQEIAEEVECAYRTAHAKLSELEEQGEITSRKVGNAKLWRLTNDE